MCMLSLLPCIVFVVCGCAPCMHARTHTNVLHMYVYALPVCRVETDASFTHWGWSPRFREDGLVLEQSVVLPLAIQYALTRLPGDGMCTLGEWKAGRKPFEPRMVAFNEGMPRRGYLVSVI